jgi:ribosomal protein S27AE
MNAATKGKTMERFAAHDFEVTEIQRSKIRKNHDHEVLVGYKCPRCDHNVGMIEHGETKICSACKLEITRFGNTLSA